MWRSTYHFLAQMISRKAAEDWHPLLAVFYLTYACNFRCPYCSDGAKHPYHQLRCDTLPAEKVLELLRHIRRYCDYLVITGGEPFQYAEVDRVLAGLKDLNFDGVILTTNGYDLEQHLESVASSIQHLVISLDSMDHHKSDTSFGLGPGVLKRIIKNIDLAAEVQRQAGFEIIISSVATPENIDGLYDVYRFARDRGFRFAVCPELVGVKPRKALNGNQAYQQFFDFLITEKQRGQKIHGTPLYLQYMKELRQFRCRPSTLLAVAPNGNVFYPCLELGKIAGNLLMTQDLKRIRQQGIQLFGPEPTCDNRCQSACALGFSLLLDHPLSYLGEALQHLRGTFHRFG